MSAQPTRVSRAQIVQLGRAGDAWKFIPLGAQALRIAPDDHEMRLLVIAAFSSLGLRTPATDHLRAFPTQIRQHPEIEAIEHGLDQIVPDSISDDERLATCRTNIAALSRRGIDLETAFAEWSSHLPERVFCRAVDGNIVCREANPDDPSAAWSWLGNLKGGAQALAVEHLASNAGQHQPPLIIEGLGPPWMFEAAMRTTPPTADGYQPTIRLLQADPAELLDGLSLTNLADALSEPRVELYIGPDAPQQLEAALNDRLDCRIAGPVIPLTTTRTPCAPAPMTVVNTVVERQTSEQDELQKQVRDTYDPRTPAWWARRYEAALNSTGEPLRILIPSCLHSTFVQHSSRDLCNALQEAGHDVRMLIEPDGHSRMSPSAYLRAMRDFQPDLVILINYTRADMQDLIPQGVPFVCWIQDAMPHQFSEDTAQTHGPLDFLVGHLHRELFDVFGYPSERCLHMPVVASSAKFHPTPISATTRSRFECEIGLVSHHSESPQSMHERLREEASGNPLVVRAIDALRPRIEAILADGLATVPVTEMKAAALEEAQNAGLGDDPRTITLLRRQYCFPYADRLLRHEAIEWAAELASEHGWRLHLYGRGWEDHPTFREFARGELTHGDDLRCAYQAAAVQIHASISTITHQRVLECALSGGLPIARLTRDHLSIVNACVQHALVRDAEQAVRDSATQKIGFHITDHSESMALASLRQRLGIEQDAFLWIGEKRLEVFSSSGPKPLETRPDWLMIDLAQTAFWNREGLERIVQQAIERPAWRRTMSDAIATRVRSRLTHDVFGPQVVHFVADSLKHATSATSDISTPSIAA